MKTIRQIFDIGNLSEIEVIEKNLSVIDVNTQDSEGRTLLMESAIWGERSLMRVLLKNGANPNLKDGRKWTALHFAAQAYDGASAEILIEHGADLNAQDDFGNTVLARAVFNFRDEGDLLAMLVHNGADPTIKNNWGISALDLAQTISNYNPLPHILEAMNNRTK